MHVNLFGNVLKFYSFQFLGKKTFDTTLTGVKNGGLLFFFDTGTQETQLI